MGPGWDSLIRFKDASGQVKFGEPDADLKTARVWDGSDILALSRTDDTLDVAEVLAPYEPDAIIAIGLNYKEHAIEANRNIPSYPVVFHKRKTSVNGPFCPVHLHPYVQDVDYENELCFIVSKDAKDVSETDASDYILAYTIGNDISSRYWQAAPRSGGMASYAKSFDGFTPLGPRLVSAKTVGDPQRLKMATRRNGKVVQDSSTADMIFGVYNLLSFLSQGSTLSAGTLVMTGTPPGVAGFLDPPNFLKKGEVVECEIEKIGCLKNEFV